MSDFFNVAVLVPCFNEASTIGKVVKDFQAHLPGAKVYCFDNNSTDRTAEVASSQGAIVIPSIRQGKGNVVRHMFEEVEAEHYVMVDGDDTYPAEEVARLIQEARSTKVHMLVGTRLKKAEMGAFRPFHRLGNSLITKMISELFGMKLTDVLSGYRVFNKEFVKSIPLTSEGFEIETELTLQAITKGFQVRESDIAYRCRPRDSVSKLSTFTDGFLIFKAIFFILKDYKPMVFFSIFGLLLTFFSILVGMLPIREFLETGRILRIPSTILASGLGILAVISFASGLILQTTHRYHFENFQLWRKLFKKL